MSYAGVTVAGAGQQLYFCHQCNHTVTINVSPTSDIVCPTCQSGFVEEFENPNSDNHNHPPYSADAFFSSLDQISNLFDNFSARSVDPQNPGRFVSYGADDFNPLNYLMNHLSSLRANGVNFEFVVEDHHGGGVEAVSLPGNIGDYFMGPGFEQLIQQLSENDPNRYGTPPAAKSAVERLPDVKVDESMMNSELAQCAVCKDDFELNVEVKQMPCKHVYHKDCILPWLEMHNSCPVCRYELPTDDPDYENRDRGSSGDRNGSGAGSSSGRQFTVSLPWPWGFGSSSHGGGSDSSRQGN